MGLRGLEPLTSSLSGKRSNRLSYRPVRHLHRTRFRNLGHRPAALERTSPSLFFHPRGAAMAQSGSQRSSIDA